jgi:hypothetical protein
VEPVDEPATGADALRDAWNAWVTNGPDGPIADDDEPEFP